MAGVFICGFGAVVYWTLYYYDIYGFKGGDVMKDKDKETTDKLNKWLSNIGLSEECNKDYCNIETKDNELTELIKEQHRNE